MTKTIKCETNSVEKYRCGEKKGEKAESIEICTKNLSLNCVALHESFIIPYITYIHLFFYSILHGYD